MVLKVLPGTDELGSAQRVNAALAFGFPISLLEERNEENVLPARRLELSAYVLLVQDAVVWYTTMAGKKATLRCAREALHAMHVPAVRTTEFVQGRTSRWGLAWSFSAGRVSAEQPLPRPAVAARIVPR